MNKVRFGIIGLGSIGSRHLKCINENDRSELVAVFDILQKKKLNTSNNTTICHNYHDLHHQ